MKESQNSQIKTPAVVVADRAAFQRRILRLILEKEGMKVTAEAGSLPELLAEVEAHPAHLILCDAMILLEAAENSVAGLAQERTLIVTGQETDEPLFLRLLGAGAQNFLLKPYTAAAVRQALLDSDFWGPADVLNEREDDDAP